MKMRGPKQIPMEQILTMTKELNPDDLEIGEVDTIEQNDIENLQSMIEMRDDYNPDDDLFTTPREIRLGDGEDGK